MTQALLVSNAVLWMVVVLLACVVAALARQIGVLHERVAPAGALMVGKGPAVGEPAPVVRTLDLAGTVRDLGAPGAEGRSTLLFFLSPTCPVCKALLPVLRQVARRESDWLGIVLASDGARDEHEAFVRARGLVNTREHLESLFEAKERGVASIQDFLRAAEEQGGAVQR